MSENNKTTVTNIRTKATVNKEDCITGFHIKPGWGKLPHDVFFSSCILVFFFLPACMIVKALNMYIFNVINIFTFLSMHILSFDNNPPREMFSS